MATGRLWVARAVLLAVATTSCVRADQGVALASGKEAWFFDWDRPADAAPAEDLGQALTNGHAQARARAPPAVGHATYGPHAFLGLTDPQLQDVHGWRQRLAKAPFFGEVPRFLPRHLCKMDEFDPVGQLCSPWPLLSGFTNPTLFEIPKSSELRQVGRYMAVARRIGTPGHTWFDGSEVFEPPQQNTTETQLRPTVMLLGDDMRVKALTLLYDAVHPHGWVDVRLYMMGNEWWVHFRAPSIPLEVMAQRRRRANMPTDGPLFRAVMARVDFTATEIPGYTSLVATFDHTSYIPLEGMVAGKNHAVFQHKGQDFLLNMLNPVKINRLYRGNRTVEQESVYEHPVNPKLPNVKGLHLNGGKLVLIKETNELLGMAHRVYSNVWEERQPFYLRRYTNLFFTLHGEAPFGLSRISPEFCFESATQAGDCEIIQFASGFSVNAKDDRIVIPYGLNRLEGKVFTTSLSQALASLRPVEDL